MKRLGRFVAAFRWLFMPIGLLALVAVGIHAAADVVDDHVLRLVEMLDAWLDGLLSQSPTLAPWVDRIDAKERTVLARGLAVVWEVSADVVVALPLLGYDEDDGARASLNVTLKRVNAAPTPMRLLRPPMTAVFVLGGAYAAARLVEATLFVGLVNDVAPPTVASVLARVASMVTFVVVLFSHGWRAVLRSLQHADEACLEAAGLHSPRTGAPRSPRLLSRGRALFAGTFGTLVALPLACALAMQARSLMSLVLL